MHESERTKHIDPVQFSLAVRARQRRQRLRDAVANGRKVSAIALFLIACGITGMWRHEEIALAANIKAGSSSTKHRTVFSNLGYVPAAVPSSDLRNIAYLQSGENIDTALIRSGITAADAARSAHLIDATIFPDRVATGTALVIVGKADRQGLRHSLQELSLRPRLNLMLAVRRDVNGLSLIAKPFSVDTTPLQLVGMVGPDLAGSLTTMHASVRLIADVQKLVHQHLNAASPLQPHDRFELVFEQSRASDGKVETGGLIYMALRRADQPLLELVRWRGDRDLADVEQDLTAGAKRSASKLPVVGHLTSRYGMRFHPILGFTRLHAGIDIAAPWGAPVVAAREGTVTFAGWQAGHGNYVRLDHGGGLGTGYAHLSGISVVVGQRIFAGQRVGYVGSTGLSTGPHLHYEVFHNGRAVDPLRQGVVAGSTTKRPSQEFVAAISALRSLIRTP